ncbi:hypothetical protein NL453_28405, partial [Klebsiella pneumoniae]|nr:hypothetical protein [Klebsiella pneumoniae]
QLGQQIGQSNVIQPPAGTFGGSTSANDSSIASGLHRPSAPIASAFAAPDRSPMQPVQGPQATGARQASAPTAPIQSNPAGMANQG